MVGKKYNILPIIIIGLMFLGVVYFSSIIPNKQQIVIYGYDMLTGLSSTTPLPCDENVPIGKSIIYVNQCSLLNNFNQILPFVQSEAQQTYGTNQIIIGSTTPNTQIAQGTCNFQNSGQIGINYIYAYCKSKNKVF